MHMFIEIYYSLKWTHGEGGKGEGNSDFHSTFQITFSIAQQISSFLPPYFISTAFSFLNLVFLRQAFYYSTIISI